MTANTLRGTIKGNCAEYGIPYSDVARMLGISVSTLNKHLANGTMTLYRLREIADYLHFTDEQKANVLSIK